MNTQEVVVCNLDPAYEEAFDNIYAKLREHFVVTIVTKAREAEAAIKKVPKAVVVVDGLITEDKHTSLHLELVLYAHSGGIILFAGVFSTMVNGSDFRDFIFNWRLGWEFADYHRSDFIINPTSFLQQAHKEEDLPKKYSMKVLHLRGVAERSRAYIPAPGSSTQPLMFAAEPVKDLKQTAIAFARVGHGYLGFIGDASSEKETIEVIFQMCLTPTTYTPLQPTEEEEEPQQETQDPTGGINTLVDSLKNPLDPTTKKTTPPPPPPKNPPAPQTTNSKNTPSTNTQTTNSKNTSTSNNLPSTSSKNKCAKCGKDAVSWCGNCKTVWYCSRECQKGDWSAHKPVCTPSAAPKTTKKEEEKEEKIPKNTTPTIHPDKQYNASDDDDSSSEGENDKENEL